MPFIKNQDVQLIDIAPGVHQRPIISADTGAESIFMGEIVVDPGSKIPLHYHSVEDIILVREGTGRIELPGESHDLKGGETSVIVPAGVQHRVINTGDGPLKIVFAFPNVNADRILVEEE